MEHVKNPACNWNRRKNNELWTKMKLENGEKKALKVPVDFGAVQRFEKIRRRVTKNGVHWRESWGMISFCCTVSLHCNRQGFPSIVSPLLRHCTFNWQSNLDENFISQMSPLQGEMIALFNKWCHNEPIWFITCSITIGSVMNSRYFNRGPQFVLNSQQLIKMELLKICNNYDQHSFSV